MSNGNSHLQRRAWAAGHGASRDAREAAGLRWLKSGAGAVLMVLVTAFTMMPSAALAADPPVVVQPLEDLTLTVGTGQHFVDLRGVYYGELDRCVVVSSDNGVATVILDGGYDLYVDPVGVGQAEIMLTGINAYGSVDHGFTVTVNHVPPETVGEFPELELRVGDVFPLEAVGGFTGEALSYTAVSSDEDAATVSVDGSTASITAIAKGSTTITITATNTGGSAHQSFDIWVLDVPPMAVGELPNVEMRVGDDPLMVEIEEAFSGSALQFMAASSDEDIASVTLTGTTVAIEGHVAGMATVTVTASNSEGSADQVFMVHVRDVPPMAVGEIDPVEMRVGDDAVMIDVAEAFSGTALQFSAASSDDSTASVSVSGTTVSIEGHVAGMATITVTAMNTEGSADQPIMVHVRDVPAMAVGEIDAMEMRIGDDALMIDVSEAFSGTGLSFSAASSDASIASVSLAGSMLAIEGHVAGMATITVTATNTENSVDQVFMVHVRDVPPMAVGEIDPVEMRIGDDPVMIDVSGAFSGTALQFSAASSDENIASVSLTGTTLSIQVHVAGLAAITVTATNTEGSAEQTIDVTSRDVPPMAVGELPDINLLVGDDAVAVDVTEAFSGTALNFSVASSSDEFADVSISGATVTVQSVAHGTTMVTVTATNTEGSADQAFMVVVEDVPPSVAAALPDVHLVAGGENVLVDVNGAFGGTALVYSASVSGDSVSLTQAGSHFTLAPLVEGLSTVTVTAANGSGQLSQSFTASVSTDAAESDALENTVAAIARSTLASITSAFSTRFRAERQRNPEGSSGSAFAADGLNPYDPFAPPGMSAAAQFSNWTPFDSAFSAGSAGGWNQGQGMGHGSAYGMPGMSGGLRQLAGRSFVMPMNAAGSGSGSSGAPAEWTFWGHVDRQSFDGSDYDGDLVSVYIGADAKFGDNWLAGVAISRSSGDADYEFSSAMASGTGDIDTDMVSILPYVHFAIDDKAELWAATGFGWGDIDLKRSATAQESEADLSMWMIAAGGRRTLASGADWNFGLTGDAGVLQMDADDGVGLLDDMDVSVGRVMIAFEGERIISSEGGNVFSVFGQVGGRHDSGDGDTGSGVELAGGVRYDTQGRVSIEAKARLLSLHSADSYEENGVSISAMVRPRSDGSGMSLAVSSYMGTGMNGTNQSLEQGYGYPGSVENFGYERDTWGMDAQLGYTVRVQRLDGLLTPFARFDMAGRDGRGMQMGLRYDLANPGKGTMLNLEFSGGQEYDRFRRETNNMVQLRGELRF